MTDQPIAADFPYTHQTVTVHGSQMAYVDLGEGDPILFLHGNPTSSYLWRNVIPHLKDSGRCIAPDLIGMGRSDKPNLPYRFSDHVRYIDGFIEALGLENIVLVIHDWGSALGFHYAHRHPDNVRALVFMEAIIRPMKFADMPGGFRLAFQMFRTPLVGELLSQYLNVFVTQLLPNAIDRDLTTEEMARYREPFPTPASRKPVMQWPREIPFDGKPADNHEIVAAYDAWLQKTEIPKLLFHADPGGLIPAELAQWCEANYPNLTRVELGAGIHYVQEDHPHTIGQRTAKWLAGLEA